MYNREVDTPKTALLPGDMPHPVVLQRPRIVPRERHGNIRTLEPKSLYRPHTGYVGMAFRRYNSRPKSVRNNDLFSIRGTSNDVNAILIWPV